MYYTIILGKDVSHLDQDFEVAVADHLLPIEQFIMAVCFAKLSRIAIFLRGNSSLVNNDEIVYYLQCINSSIMYMYMVIN